MCSGGHWFDSCRALRFFFLPRSRHVDQFTFHLRKILLTKIPLSFARFADAHAFCTLRVSQSFINFLRKSEVGHIFTLRSYVETIGAMSWCRQYKCVIAKGKTGKRKPY